MSVAISTFGTGKIPDEDILKRIKRVFPLTPKGIIEKLDLLKPIYYKTACYGHFGREKEGFTWEKKDMVDVLK